MELRYYVSYSRERISDPRPVLVQGFHNTPIGPWNFSFKMHSQRKLRSSKRICTMDIENKQIPRFLMKNYPKRIICRSTIFNLQEQFWASLPLFNSVNILNFIVTFPNLKTPVPCKKCCDATPMLWFDFQAKIPEKNDVIDFFCTTHDEIWYC